MAHCSPEKLNDLKPYLEDIASWPGIKEKSLGIYYFKTIPFLHFHEKENARWAHVKEAKNWKTIPISFNSTKSERDEFFKYIETMYKKFIGPSKKT